MAIRNEAILSIYNSTFPEWQKRMEAEPYSFVFPKLSENLRNSKNVIEFTEKHRDMRFEDLYGSPVKADGPKHHPVIGPQPEYIECDAGNLHDILRTTLEKNYPEEEEPVVILCNYGMNVSTVFANLKRKMMSGDPENQRTEIEESDNTEDESEDDLNDNQIDSNLPEIE
ncbi:uncharacterized protein LOC111717076 [Eurytemora carolleeae]|uniref:uncharacterized protein LOC111717076 n=1 Tax=Eurytemora carolleeae TaxID=1294199 RepID=UPI000C76C99B|nr:uncharacterized protein LOC111717076 [Eurytemora carolleeae]|eukprot:XP_023348359.1 uncharacterized protein LOC111717076 [Eurytemora affinis]